MIDHAPVPTTGVFAAKVVEVNPHIAAPLWSGPASATVGFCWNVMPTSCGVGTEGAFLFVPGKVKMLPATQLKVEIGLMASLKLPRLLLLMHHATVLTAASFAA